MTKVDLYEQLYAICDNGIDCSEIAEQFISMFKGKAFLFLAKDYRKYKMFEITDAQGNNHEFLYHYAYIDNESLVWDPMLGFKGVNIETYKLITNIQGSYTTEIVKGPSLKCYC